MLVINWLKLKPSKDDLKKAADGLEKVIHIRSFLKALVKQILAEHPWEVRADTSQTFDPSLNYHPNQIVAFPQPDPQSIRPTTWRLGSVIDIAYGQNPIQGEFQVVTVKIGIQRKQLAANIAGAKPFEFDLSLGDTEDIEWLVGDFVDTYYPQLHQTIETAISQGDLNASIQGENLILGELSETLGEIEIEYLLEIIGKKQAGELWISAADLLTKIRELGGFGGLTDDLAIYLIETYLESQGFISVGQNRWILPEKLDEIDRSIQVRPKVPVVQSKVIKELGQQEDEKFTDYEEVELEEEGQAALETFGEDSDFEVIAVEDWTPPTTPIQLPTITYQNIIEAFFPLSANLRKAFPGKNGVLLVEIQVAQGAPLPFIINREEGLIKAIDRDHVRQRLLEESIAAGTKLWLEYQHGLTYRIFPKPLAQPVNRKCKIANWDDAGNLTFSIEEIPINYEHEAQIFVAEFRHADPIALFKEAELSGLSIFDALYYSIQELAAISPNQQVHYFELFNAVFFRHRMCSPRSVITELYSRPCFVPTGDGYFQLDIEKGFRRSGIRKKSKPKPKPQPPKPRRAHPPASGYFIFQQNPEGVSEYQDELGKVYNWRQGIPGSNQIKANSRFIYYRPGEKVFFGSGLIQKIESYVTDDGTQYHNGIITEYESWDPPLIFAEELSRKMSFHDPRRIWIGQMGIRQITQEDYYAIFRVYQSTNLEKEDVDKFVQRSIKQLVGRQLHTLDQKKPFLISKANGSTTVIRTSTGEIRKIDNHRIKAAWEELINFRELTRTDIHARYSEFNPAYIAAILSAFPNVSHTTNPIKLVYQPPQQEIGGKVNLDQAFLLGLVLGRGEINRDEHKVTITLSYGRYKNGTIIGGNGQIILNEDQVLPAGAEQIFHRIENIGDQAIVTITSSSIYRHNIVIKFDISSSIYNLILDWYPSGHNWHTFQFPKEQLDKVPDKLAIEFMRGAASILGFITDNTRAGLNGRHRVFFTYSRENKNVLQDVRDFLESRFGVQVPHIHWHEGWDPQMRIYAEDFEKIGFYLFWKDEILKAAALENKKMTDPTLSGQMTLFEEE